MGIHSGGVALRADFVLRPRSLLTALGLEAGAPRHARVSEIAHDFHGVAIASSLPWTLVFVDQWDLLDYVLRDLAKGSVLERKALALAPEVFLWCCDDTGGSYGFIHVRDGDRRAWAITQGELIGEHGARRPWEPDDDRQGERTVLAGLGALLGKPAQELRESLHATVY